MEESQEIGEVQESLQENRVLPSAPSPCSGNPTPTPTALKAQPLPKSHFHWLLLPTSQWTQPCGPQAGLCGLTLSCRPCQEGLPHAACSWDEPQGAWAPRLGHHRELELAQMQHPAFSEIDCVGGQAWRGSCSCEKGHSFIHFFHRGLLRPCSVSNSGLGTCVLRHMILAHLRRKTRRKYPELESLGSPISGVSDSVSLGWA